MKTYKKVEVEAVNASSGSYVAGCSTNADTWCVNCQRSR